MTKKKTDEEQIEELQKQINEIYAKQEKLVIKFLKNTLSDDGRSNFEIVLEKANEWNSKPKRSRLKSVQDLQNESEHSDDGFTPGGPKE